MQFQPWAESDAAVLHEQLGERAIIDGQGRFWFDGGHGFWRPVDILRPMDVDRTRPPARMAIGFHCLVVPPERASRALTFRIIDEVSTYDLDRVTKKRRQEIRRSLRSNDIRLLDTPDELLEFGFAITVQARRRSGQRAPSSPEQFHRQILKRWELGPQLVVGGFNNGRLVGFILSHVLGRTAYMEDVYISDEGRAVEVGSGMYFSLAQAVRELDAADRIWMGWDEPDFPGLTAFKKSTGAQLRHFPAEARLVPGLAAILRRRRPHTYHRLAGRPLGDTING